MGEIRLDNLNSNLINIWETFLKKEHGELHPVYYRAVPPSELTFIGMNPSFNIKGMIKTIANTEYENLDIVEYFEYLNNDFDIQVSQKIDVLSEKKYSTFFKQHHELAKQLNANWLHLDLFQYRQTSQKMFLGKILNRDGSLNKFGQPQFDLFTEALKLSSPKIIVIANAKAARIFKANNVLRFSNKFGTYQYDLGTELVPVFLSGMLTGGRALDIFSRERLFWHINSVYNTTTPNT